MHPALEKFFNGILMVWAVLNTVYSFSPRRLKSHYPGFFRWLERWLTYLWFVITPIGFYDCVQLFRSSDQSSRGVIVFLLFVVLIGSVAQWRNSQNKSKPNQS
jgi:hypothetical protein